MKFSLNIALAYNCLLKFQEDWPISFKDVKGQNQNFEKAIIPVFTDLVTNVLASQLYHSLSNMLRHHAMWRLAIILIAQCTV